MGRRNIQGGETYIEPMPRRDDTGQDEPIAYTACSDSEVTQGQKGVNVAKCCVKCQAAAEPATTSMNGGRLWQPTRSNPYGAAPIKSTTQGKCLVCLVVNTPLVKVTSVTHIRRTHEYDQP